jgi:hypothetical protein
VARPGVPVVTVHPVPAARAALVALLHGLYPADSTVRVDHGPPVAPRDRPDAIGVGVRPRSEGAAGTGTSTARVGKQTEEQFDLAVAIDSATGDADDDALARCEDRVFALLDELDELIQSDRSLGGAVMTTQRTAYTLWPRRDTTGAGALLEVTLRVHGFHRRT